MAVDTYKLWKAMIVGGSDSRLSNREQEEASPEQDESTLLLEVASEQRGGLLMESKRGFLIASIMVCATTLQTLATPGEGLAQTKAKSRQAMITRSLPEGDEATVKVFKNSRAVGEAIKKAFARSGCGTLNKEFGFAVVVNADGSLLVTGVTGFEAGRWQASIPASAVAVFHTHRDAVSPRPSGQDRREADRLQVSFFVISRQGLWAYEPDPSKQGKGRAYRVQWH